MYIGLLHSHSGIAYLLFLAALVNVVLAFLGAQEGGSKARVLHWSHKIGVMGLGRLNLVLGLGMVFMNSAYMTAWWAWAALLLWGPAEVMAKRFVKPELELALEGGTATKRLVTGTAVQLAVVVVIFGLMSVKP